MAPGGTPAAMPRIVRHVRFDARTSLASSRRLRAPRVRPEIHPVGRRRSIPPVTRVDLITSAVGP